MKLTNGRTTMEVPDDKAEKLMRIMGLRPLDETPTEPEAPKPPTRRGRPPKKEN